MKSPVRFMARGLAEAAGDENPVIPGAMRTHRAMMCNCIVSGMSSGRFADPCPDDGDAVTRGGDGDCDGNGGGDVIGRGGSRQAPALRPAIIQ